MAVGAGLKDVAFRWCYYAFFWQAAAARTDLFVLVNQSNQFFLSPVGTQLTRFVMLLPKYFLQKSLTS